MGPSHNERRIPRARRRTTALTTSRHQPDWAAQTRGCAGFCLDKHKYTVQIGWFLVLRLNTIYQKMRLLSGPNAHFARKPARLAAVRESRPTIATVTTTSSATTTKTTTVTLDPIRASDFHTPAPNKVHWVGWIVCQMETVNWNNRRVRVFEMRSV